MPSSKDKLQNISFYILLAIVGLTVVFMFSPFFKLVALGGILAVLFNPLRLKITKYVKSDTLAALITLVFAGVVILVPIYIIGQLAFNEILSVYNNTAQGLFQLNQSSLFLHLSPSMHNFAQNFLADANQKMASLAGNAFQSLASLATNVAGFVLGFILVVFTMYYFLRDGARFRAFVEEIFPLSHANEELLVAKLEMAINGVVQGSFTVALLQGTVSTIGFFIFGVPQPLLWGLFTVLASLVPTVGTLVSLVPAIAYLFLTGNIGAGIGMTIWAFLSIQGIDNFISPRVIGHKVHLHPLVTLLSVLGGITMFGYLGFLLGPILMSMFMALLDIYKINSKKA